jgi:predicted nucleic acid-binding protein
MVVDTSVVLKWIVAEEGSDVARRLIGSPLLAPDLIRAELPNALWKKVAIRREINADQAQAGLEIASEALRLIPSAPLADQALALGLHLAHPVYDCFFVVLAQQLGVPLISADRRLVRRLVERGMDNIVTELREWRDDG